MNEKIENMYKSYEEYHPRGTGIPKHIAIIPDGGRRWAEVHGCPNYNSYKLMCERLFEFCDDIYRKGIFAISIYFSSIQNFTRSEEEVDAFCKAETEFMKTFARELSIRHQVQIIVAGERKGVPQYMLQAIGDMDNNKGGYNKKLYLCINYDPHREIERAVLKAKEADGLYVNYLDVKEPVDIVIRTGGAKVISNFLAVQSGFARLFFLDKLFNDIKVEDITNILNTYSGFELKYGT